KGSHGSTFAGNPLVCAAGTATLRVLADKAVHTRAQHAGDRFQERLRGLRLPQVREVRGRGLMLAVELKKPTTPVIKAMQEHSARVFRGEKGPAEMRGLDVNQGNALIYRRWRRRRPADVVAWHRQVQNDVMQTLRKQSDDWFGRRERGPNWPGDFDGHSAW